MSSTLELRWEFTPVDFFEETAVYTVDECSITIEEGTAVAVIPVYGGDFRSALRGRIESYVERLFLGAQLIDHQKWTLGGPSISTVQADGTRGYVLECGPGVFQVRFGRMDARVAGPDGSVIDTKRSRIERKRRLGIAVASLAGEEEVLGRMVRSYRAAIADPQDELIHLFELRDTLASRFGSDKEAIRRLPWSKTKWSRFGVLCNVLPLREGRHRGKFGADLRSGTEDELREARDLAVGLIEAYIQYLQRSAA